MSLVLVARPRASEDAGFAPAPPDEGDAARVGAGELGHAGALAAYRRRADRIALGAFGVAVVATFGALLLHPVLGVVALVCALGAAFDRARGRLGAALRLDADVAVVVAGPHAGMVLPRAAIVAVGFGPAPAPGASRAPETFWRADFGGTGRSHLLVVRLAPAAGRPRRLVVPERDARAAQAAAVRLRAWITPST